MTSSVTFGCAKTRWLPLPPTFLQVQHLYEAYQVIEAHSGGASASDAGKKSKWGFTARRLRNRYDKIRVMAERVQLAQLISQLLQDLSVGMREGEREELRFELGPVELELTVAVSKEAGPNAKVRFWMVELGANAKVASQRIMRTLAPRRRGIAGKPLISGSEVFLER